jgi:hypothetical protein
MNARSLAAIYAACFTLLLPLHAQVPQLMNYQGRVVVGTTNFNGTGQFKFALVNSNGSTTYWSNDGTSNAGSEPTNAVSLGVANGLYSVLLGDTSVANMTVAIPTSVFSNGDVRLRVWFNDGTHGSQLLTPDQRIASVGYAEMAANVPDGAITSSKIANGAVGTSQIATGAITSAQIDNTTVQQRITASAPAGQFITGINPDGTVVSAAIDNTIPRLGSANTFSNLNVFNGKVGIGVASPSYQLDLQAGTEAGIRAISSGPFQAAVDGEALATTGSAIAGRFLSASPTGYGLFVGATATSGQNIGIYAYSNSPNGFAGYFNSGKSYFGGNVGIGNTSPSYNLDVAGTVNATQFLLNGAPFSTSQWLNNGSDIYFSAGKVGVGKNNPATALDVSGTVTATTFAGSGSGLTNLAAANLTGVISTSQLADGSVTGTKIDSSTVQKRVTGSASAGTYITAINTDGTVVTGVDANSGGTVTSITAGDGLTGGTITGSGTIAIDTSVPRLASPNTFTGANNFNGGNVGIGTTNPSATLHVVGNVIANSPTASNHLATKGYVDAATGGAWLINGNSGTTPGTNFLGTTDNSAFEMRVGNVRAFRLEPTSISPNVIGGYSGNNVSGGFLYGATIGGGGTGGSPNHVAGPFGTIAGGFANSANGDSSAIAGGKSNIAGGESSAIAGGFRNTASGQRSAVAGGDTNTASGLSSGIAGGQNNVASGSYSFVAGGLFNGATGESSFAAGDGAQANYDGDFVWADFTGSNLYGFGPNQFVVRASGGTFFFSSANSSTGVILSPGSGGWGSLSDRNAKENIEPIDKRSILNKVVALPVAEWNYKTQDQSIRHIGPMAQDFSAAFGIGEDNKHINTVDEQGVTLAAIQGLYQIVREKDAEIAALKSEVAKLRRDSENRLSALEEKLARSEPTLVADQEVKP